MFGRFEKEKVEKEKVEERKFSIEEIIRLFNLRNYHSLFSNSEERELKEFFKSEYDEKFDERKIVANYLKNKRRDNKLKRKIREGAIEKFKLLGNTKKENEYFMVALKDGINKYYNFEISYEFNIVPDVYKTIVTKTDKKGIKSINFCNKEMNIIKNILKKDIGAI
jgi:hypothetical protein